MQQHRGSPAGLSRPSPKFIAHPSALKGTVHKGAELDEGIDPPPLVNSSITRLSRD